MERAAPSLNVRTNEHDRIAEELAAWVTHANSHLYPTRRVYAIQRVRELRAELQKAKEGLNNE